MVVKNQIKFIKSLQQKKYRTQHGLFVVEGVKLVNELVRSTLSMRKLYKTADLVDDDIFDQAEIISESELQKMSGLKSPNKVLGVFEIPQPEPLDFNDWVLALDQVQDPGNLGTIIRLCDWFGVKHLLCSTNTVDCYNPKTLQATMGSIARVNIVYDSISNVVKDSGASLFATFMNGRSIYEKSMPDRGILLLGNESHGISDQLRQLADFQIAIPRYGSAETESLNVATATAILLSEIRRGVTRK